jgi:basic membrane protein A
MERNDVGAEQTNVHLDVWELPLDRKRMLALCALLGVEVALAGPAGAFAAREAKKKVALVLTFKKNVGNFDPSAYAGFSQMVKRYGFDSEIAEVAGYDQAPSVLSDFGQRGFDMVIANSQGYQAAVLQVAPKYPDTWFVIYPDASTTGGNKNVASWVPDPYEMQYLPGVVAGLMTKTNKLGIVGSIPLPAIRGEAAGFEDGAKSVNSKVKVSAIWINSFTDVAKAKEAALSLYDGGADIVVHLADTAGLGVFQAAREQKKWAIGAFADEGKRNRDVVLTSGTFNFWKHYGEMGQLLASGKLQAKLYKSTVCDDGLIMGTVNHVPANVLARVQAVKSSICSGKLKLKPRLAPNP